MRGYACGLHPGTLQALDRVGLLPAVLEAAHRVDRLAFRHGAARVATAEFGHLEGGFPYALTLRQAELEQILEDALERRGVNVSRLQQVMRVDPMDGFVRVTAQAKLATPNETPSGEFAEAIGLPTIDDADFVIGADGYFSACREAAGIELLEVKPPKAFAICEFAADLSGWEREACVVLGTDCVGAFWPLGANLGRWTFEVWEELDQVPTLGMLEELIAKRAPWFSPKPEQLCWGAIAQFEHRIVRRFGSGRIWLAGDAAHSTSPIGFQSMNRGFREVEALATLIAGALYDEDHRPGRFDRFEQAQQEEWRRLFGLAAPLGEWMPAGELAPCLPASGSELEALCALLGVRLE